MPTFEITAPDGTKYHVEGPEGATEEQALAQVQAAHQPSAGTDILKSLPGDVASAVSGTLGTPGDIRELMSSGISKGAGMFGYDVPSGTVSSALRHVPLLGTPTSQQFQSGIEKVAGGPFAEPQTTAGKATKTAIGLAPALLGGPEALIPKLITRVAAPTAAVTATQAMGGGPIAQTAAAIGSSALAHRLTAPKVASVAPSPQELMSMGPVEALKNPVVDSVYLKSLDIEKVANSFKAQLTRDKLGPIDAPRTYSQLENMKEPLNGQAHQVADLQKTRERLSDIAKDFNAGDDRAAATSAIKQLDQYLANVPKSHVLAGDMPAAAQIMATSRANFAHGAAAAGIADRIRNAELQTASSHSGGNIDNALRQKLRPVLTTRTGRMGYKPEDLDAITNTVTGGTTGNVLRATGKVLGGGGGLGMLHASGLGAALGLTGGPVGSFLGGVATPIIGYGIKRAGDALTKANAASVVQRILERSPEGQARAAIAARAGIRPGRSAKAAGLLGGALNARQQGLLGPFGSDNNERP